MTEKEAIKAIEIEGGIEITGNPRRIAKFFEGLEIAEEALKRQIPKKPIYRHYEEDGEKPYIKITCPNGCRIQLYPVTEKHFAHEHNYCPKCGQAIDWSETGGQR